MKNKFLGTGQEGFHPIRKIKVALSGLRYALKNDFAVLYKLIISVLLFAFALYYRQWVDLGLITVATGLMLASELFNTTIEALCDFVEENQNEKIGIIKDIAAAAAGVSILVWAVVTILEIFRFTGWLQT